MAECHRAWSETARPLGTSSREAASSRKKRWRWLERLRCAERGRRLRIRRSAPLPTWPHVPRARLPASMEWNHTRTHVTIRCPCDSASSLCPMPASICPKGKTGVDHRPQGCRLLKGIAPDPRHGQGSSPAAWVLMDVLDPRRGQTAKNAGPQRVFVCHLAWDVHMSADRRCAGDKGAGEVLEGDLWI